MVTLFFQLLRPKNPQSILSYLCVSYILQPHLLVNPVVTNLILLRIRPLSHHLQSYLLVQVTIMYKSNFIYSSSLSFPHCTILSQHVSQSSSCHCWKLPFISHLRVKKPSSQSNLQGSSCPGPPGDLSDLISYFSLVISFSCSQTDLAVPQTHEACTTLFLFFSLPGTLSLRFLNALMEWKKYLNFCQISSFH